MNYKPEQASSCSENAATTLFVADDHKIIRDGLRYLATKEGRFTCVGEAADGRALVEGVMATRPAVVVTDLSMTGMNGIEATLQIRAAGYNGIIVMFSMHDERQLIASALKAGVNAYVHKDHAFEQLLVAIEAAMRGEVWLSPQLRSLRQGENVVTLFEILSPREREVLQLLAEGAGTKEVAAQLSLSPKTVEAHRLHIYSKLSVNNVSDLTRIAIKEGLVQI